MRDSTDLFNQPHISKFCVHVDGGPWSASMAQPALDLIINRLPPAFNMCRHNNCADNQCSLDTPAVSHKSAFLRFCGRRVVASPATRSQAVPSLCKWRSSRIFDRASLATRGTGGSAMPGRPITRKGLAADHPFVGPAWSQSRLAVRRCTIPAQRSGTSNSADGRIRGSPTNRRPAKTIRSASRLTRRYHFRTILRRRTSQEGLDIINHGNDVAQSMSRLAYTTALVTSYGRPFTVSKGRPPLPTELIPY